MTEFNLVEELNSIDPQEILNIDNNLTNYYIEDTLKVNELDSTINELTTPDGLYNSAGLRDPAMLTKNEQQTIIESIFQGIEEETFNRINLITGKFIKLHGQGLLGSLGGIIDLVVGVIDALGLTDDLIAGFTGFLGGGGALQEGLISALGSIVGNGKVQQAVKSGAERSVKFSEDTSKRVAGVLEAELDIKTGDGNEKRVVSGTKFESTARTLNHSTYSITNQSPLYSIASDTTLHNSRTYKQISDLFSVQTQHTDYTVEDTFTINTNVYSSTANHKREASRVYVNNAEQGEYIATKELHLQAGVYGGKLFQDGVDLINQQERLNLSSTKDIYVYAGRDYYLKSKNIYAVDARFTFINMGTALVSSIFARPRKIVTVKQAANPETVPLTDNVNTERVTIANGNELLLNQLGNNVVLPNINKDKFMP